MKQFLTSVFLLTVLAGCTPPEVPVDTGPEIQPLSVPLATE